MASLASLGKFILGGIILGLGSSRSPLNTRDDVAHRAATVRSEDLDGDNVRSLSDTIFGGSDGTRAVSTVTVAVLIDIILRDGLSPASASLELDVIDVDTGVDDIYVDTFTSALVVDVASECTKAEFVPVTNTGKTLT